MIIFTLGNFWGLKLRQESIRGFAGLRETTLLAIEGPYQNINAWG